MACKLSLLPVDPRLAEYASSLHSSTDFREKLYKILQYAAKLAAAQPRLGPLPKQIASTLSQSRGIFKLLKSMNSIKSLRSALEERGLVRQAKLLEACLSIAVNSMQDVSVVNKLCGGAVVGPRWTWLTDFLDLLLALLGAGLAARAIRQLHASGADLQSPVARRKLLLCGRREDRTRAMLRLELGVRIGDAINLLEATSRSPGKRQLWRAPSPNASMLASLASASFATTAIALKKWPERTPPAAANDEAQKQKGG